MSIAEVITESMESYLRTSYAEQLVPIIYKYINETDEVTEEGLSGLFNVESNSKPSSVKKGKGKAPVAGPSASHVPGQCSYMFKKGANAGKYCSTKTAEEFCTSHSSAKKKPTKAAKIPIKPGVNTKLTKNIVSKPDRRAKKFRDGLCYDLEFGFVMSINGDGVATVVGMKDGNDIRKLTDEELDVANKEDLLVDEDFLVDKKAKEELEEDNEKLISMPTF